MSKSFAQLGFALLLAGAMAIASAEPGPSSGAAAPRQRATTWIAAAEPTWGSDFVLPLGMPQQLHDVTLRQHLRISIGSKRLRLVVSNEYGRAPLAGSIDLRELLGLIRH